MSISIDHIVEAEKRLITQYTEADSVKKYLQAVLVEANELEQVFCDLMLKRALDTAEGEQLDIIGEIVGQPRILINSTQLFFFGFETAPGAQSFGDLNDAQVGGRFRSLNESGTGGDPLTDEEYRIFIRARIAKNYTAATLEEIISQIKFILQEPDLGVYIIEGDRAYTVVFGRVLTLNERALLTTTDLIPKPLGIQASYADVSDLSFFQFSDEDGSEPGNGGFGDLTDPNVGGFFSTLLL